MTPGRPRRSATARREPWAWGSGRFPLGEGPVGGTLAQDSVRIHRPTRSRGILTRVDPGGKAQNQFPTPVMDPSLLRLIPAKKPRVAQCKKCKGTRRWANFTLGNFAQDNRDSSHGNAEQQDCRGGHCPTRTSGGSPHPYKTLGLAQSAPGSSGKPGTGASNAGGWSNVDSAPKTWKACRITS